MKTDRYDEAPCYKKNCEKMHDFFLQVGRIPIGVAKASRIMTHATQGGHKNGSMFMWTQQSMREDY